MVNASSASLFSVLAVGSDVEATRQVGTATLTESIETSDADHSVTPLLVAMYPR